MAKSDGDNQEFTPDETDLRREAALVRLLKTPHTPTKDIKKPRRKPQSK